MGTMIASTPMTVKASLADETYEVETALITLNLGEAFGISTENIDKLQERQEIVAHQIRTDAAVGLTEEDVQGAIGKLQGQSYGK